MNTEPVKALLRKYSGNILKATPKELVKAFTNSSDNLELLISQAQSEYKKEQEQAGPQRPETKT